MIALAVVASTVSTFAYTLIAPLYPLQAASRLSEPLIGQVVAAYSIANLAFVPVAGVMSRRCSDVALLAIGLLTEAAALLVVACLPLLMDPVSFLLASFFFRCLQGAADTFIGNAALSLVQKSSKRNVLARNIALLEAFRSVGNASGPLGNLLFFPVTGFSLLFVAAGCFVALVALTTWLLARRPVKKAVLSHELLDDDTSTQYSTNYVLEVAYPSVSLKDLLGVRGVLFAAAQSALMMAVWNYREPILPAHFKTLGLSDSSMAIYFLISPLASAIFGFVPMALSNRFRPRTLIIFGNIIQAAVLLLIGPSTLLGMTPSVPITALGLGLCGATFNFAFAPILAEMQLQASHLRRAPNFSSQIALLNLLARPVGFWAGPIIASLLTANFGFGTTADAFMLAVVIFTVLYLFLGRKQPRTHKTTIQDVTSRL